MSVVMDTMTMPSVSDGKREKAFNRSEMISSWGEKLS